MHLAPVRQSGTLIKRYKRFLADISLKSGELLTVHCPNSGSMRDCSDPGSPVIISKSDNSKRKYAWTLEMVQDQYNNPTTRFHWREQCIKKPLSFC